MDSEHEKNLMNDAWRLFQLEKATGNKDHPFSKFGTGRISPEFSPDLVLTIYHHIIHLDFMLISTNVDIQYLLKCVNT